jgi:formate/nitrite transporter FocA (FNT family)
VVGNFKGFLPLVHGELGLRHMLGSFTIPVLLGNVGGSALFALISYAQLMQET